ncbi:MAG TPA: uroporphyrinogen decarboxylase family protein [Planctomycetota bacterium]|nr:uroporphyrinogen decarboxylase family protein [Planctomycetota bacterium]
MAPAMTSCERVLAAINHESYDRVPLDIWATPEVWVKLRDHFGPDADIGKALHIDGFAGIGPRYIGPPAAPVPDGESVDFWGIRRRNIDYGTGVYSEIYHWPLAFAKTIDDLDRYQWPSADWFDYSQMEADAKALGREKAIQCGYMAIFYHHNMLRGLEASLVDPLLEPEFTKELLRRLGEFFYQHHLRMFEAAGRHIDVCQVTDDFGTQTGPMIGMGVFREFYRPHMQRFIDLCRSFDIKVMHHDDGGIRPFIPDLVEMGIDILNPIQWKCPGMDREELKREFGGKLCFHGGVENQEILPFGTEEDVRAEVRRNIDLLASDGTGYILCSCHCIQPVTPVGNIIAMYDEAWKYGKR